MKVFSTFLDDGGKAYYNVTEPGPVGKVVKGVGDLQRHVQAEMVLNLNPGQLDRQLGGRLGDRGL